MARILSLIPSCFTKFSILLATVMKRRCPHRPRARPNASSQQTTIRGKPRRLRTGKNRPVTHLRGFNTKRMPSSPTVHERPDVHSIPIRGQTQPRRKGWWNRIGRGITSQASVQIRPTMGCDSIKSARARQRLSMIMPAPCSAK